MNTGYVVKGTLKIEFIENGESIIVPKGVEHKACADNEVSYVICKTTVNTGELSGNDRTKEKLDWI